MADNRVSPLLRSDTRAMVRHHASGDANRHARRVVGVQNHDSYPDLGRCGAAKAKLGCFLQEHWRTLGWLRVPSSGSPPASVQAGLAVVECSGHESLVGCYRALGHGPISKEKSEARARELRRASGESQSVAARLSRPVSYSGRSEVLKGRWPGEELPAPRAPIPVCSDEPHRPMRRLVRAPHRAEQDSGEQRDVRKRVHRPPIGGETKQCEACDKHGHRQSLARLGHSLLDGKPDCQHKRWNQTRPWRRPPVTRGSLSGIRNPESIMWTSG